MRITIDAFQKNTNNTPKLNKQALVLFVLLGLFTPYLVVAQDLSPIYVFSSKPLPARQFNLSLGLSMTIIPRALVQEGVLPLPMTDVRMKYGLTDRFFLTGQVNLVYITNQVSLGAGWSHSFGALSFAIADNFGYWFGFADLEGFDASAMGLLNYPSITLGVETEGLQISFRTEALITISQHTYFGTASVGRINPKIAGVAFSLAVEQELWENNNILFGVRVQYALPMYQTWVAFSTFQRWLIFPEVFIGYEL